MKATPEFDLEAERHEFLDAVSAGGYKACLANMSNYLRGELKYNSDAYTEAEFKLLETIRAKFFEIVEDEEVKLD